tara:strand:- start:48186 stop:48614 length:429 start_codon:yes stop_codon:yes gene_type:complete
MKNLTLILLLAMAPFLTIAQVGTKGTETGKRKADQKTSSASYEFMVITGYETKPRAKSKSGSLNSAAADADAMMKTEGKYAISFDFGGVKSRSNDLLSERRYRTMAAAVNDAANYGWEFISGNAHLVQGGMTAHYYYLRKEK